MLHFISERPRRHGPNDLSDLNVFIVIIEREEEKE